MPMDETIGIFAALGVILLGLAFFVTMALRQHRAIEADGYKKTDAVDLSIKDLTTTLFECSPVEVHRKESPNGQSWLVFVDAGSSEDSRCAMLVYGVSNDELPALALIHSARPIPRIIRNLTGGLFKRLAPAAENESGGLAGTGWYAYQEPDGVFPTALKERLAEVVQIPRSSGLLGIALIDSHLAVWSDASLLRTLLAIAPLVRETILMHDQRG